MINLFSSLIICLLIVAIIVTIICYEKKIKNIKKNFESNLKLIVNTINSVRYGNLAARLIINEGTKLPALAESVNRMVETIQDREKMILEFKKEIVGHNIFLETLINSLSEGFLILNSDFVVQKMTAESIKFFGKNLEGKFLGEYIENFVDSITFINLKTSKIVLKNKPESVFLSTVSDLNFNGNDNFKYLLTMKDISKENELKQVKNNFVATLAHDLRVPLLAEHKTLDLMLDNKFGELNSQISECIKLLKNSNNDVLELTEILLETYKLEETGLTLNKNRVNINKIISDVSSEMQAIAQENGILINLNFCDDFEILLDEFNIKRVLRNLFSNSLEYAQGTEKIDVFTENSENGCYITIRDYGVGISEQEQEYIFQKFYSGASKFRKVGHGLGLYLVNEIVKAHGGKIEIFSEPNVKTDFKIFLPN